MADVFVWRGGSGAFGTAGNWDDETIDADPAVVPPGAADTAQFITGGGTITGTGTVATLQFLGSEAWTVGGGAALSVNTAFQDSTQLTVQDAAAIVDTGASVVIDSGDTATTASLAVTGTGSDFAVTGGSTYFYVGTAGDGSLSVTNGGSASAAFLIALGGALGTSSIQVDGSSSLEIGTAGGATAGALTVDAATETDTPQLYGWGTIAANVVNDDLIVAEANASAFQLEITGAVTGTGTLALDHGYHVTPGGLVYGGVLRLDESVASTQQVDFGYSPDLTEAPELILGDPAGFSGTLVNFDGPGATLDLVGDSVTGATVSGSVLTVALASGGPLNFALGGALPVTSELVTTGSEVRILPIRELDWTGASNTAFGNALNWNDTTNGQNPSLSAPGVSDLASLTNAGSVTGNGTTYQLSFDGTNTIAGTLTALASVTENTGTTDVTGALSAASVSVSGLLSAQSGGRVSSGGSVTLTPGAMLAVDALSSFEAGTAGGAAAGGVTVDASGGEIGGDGTIAATVVNNGEIDAGNGPDGDNMLEVTGAVTGSGTFNLEIGYSPGPGTIVSGSILRVDSTVGDSDHVAFGYVSDPGEAATLALGDPAGFAGILDEFSLPGDTLELIGETVTGAGVNGTTLTVDLTAGGPLTFNLGYGAPVTGQLITSGSDVRILPDRAFDWIGASGGDFANALNWDDTTGAVDPAATAPGTTDIAALANAGVVNGDGTTYQLDFDGTNTVEGTLTAIDLLADNSGSLTVTGSLTSSRAFVYTGLAANSGGRITMDGSLLMLPGASIAIDGESAIEVGTAGTGVVGSLTVDAGVAGITGDGTVAAALVNNGTINANNGNAGSNVFEVTGAITGAGGIYINVGYSPGPGTITPGAVVRLDGPVAASQHLILNNATDPRESPTLILNDPAAFSGVLDNFSGTGDTLELPGETVTGVNVAGTTMTVDLTAGGPLTFNLGYNAPVTNQLRASGDEIRVVPLRELDWTGASDTNFDNALNWNDVTEGLDPAATPPGTSDLASIVNAGSIGGDASVYQLSFAGTNTVTGSLSAIDTLTGDAGSLVVTGTLAASDATLSGTVSALSGGAVTIAGSVSLVLGGAIAVDGSSTMEIGTAGTASAGALTVDPAAGAGIEGDGTLAAALINNGEIVAESTLEVTGAVTGGGTFVLQGGSSPGTGAVLQLDSTLGSSETVIFGSSAAPDEAPTLTLEQPAAFSGTLNSFDYLGDTLDLVGETVTGAGIAGSTMTVTVTSGGPLTFALSNTPSVTQLSFAGADVSVSGTLCFLAGTMIATPNGETPVERLAAGDLVTTLKGAARPVVWVGTGRVLATRGRRNAATPVIVRKGALCANVPYYDLRVTKGHSLFLDGVLIPVECLINHRSILWDDHAQEVSLYHIELETHDVLIANGAAAESFRDDGNRWLFHNVNENWDQPPRPPCAPVLTGGPLVDAIWRRLSDRPGPRRLPPLTSDPDLHLIVDGRRIDPVSIRDLTGLFSLPDRPGAVRIVSRAAVPAELGITRDFRSLGVSVRWIALRAGAKAHVIEAADDRLSEGFHAYEPDEALRWTDGEAVLPACLFNDLSGPFDLILGLGHATRYPDGAGLRATA